MGLGSTVYNVLMFIMDLDVEVMIIILVFFFIVKFVKFFKAECE